MPLHFSIRGGKVQLEQIEGILRFEIARKAEEGISAKWSEKRPGFCERWVKQVLRHVEVPEPLRMEDAVSARAAFEEYRAAGLAMPVGTVAQIGDLMYWVRDGDGKFGHVAIKFASDRYGENSSVHYSIGTGDARGWRYVSGHPGYRVVRLWKS